MPIDLSLLEDPARVAVVFSEMQRGIVGDLARPTMAGMRDALIEYGTIGTLARLAADGRHDRRSRVPRRRHAGR
jgi:hypothetical protein